MRKRAPRDQSSLPSAASATLSSRGCCWSDGAFSGDGVPTLIYYGHPGGNCLATSDDDLVVWTKHSANPVIAHQEQEKKDYVPFEPCMWKEDGTYYAVSDGRLDAVAKGRSGDTAFLFKSRNMVDWEYLDTLYDPPKEPLESHCAVPDFFPLGDCHMLLFASHARGAQYYIGWLADERFYPEHHGRLNFGGFTLESGTAAVDFLGAWGWRRCGRWCDAVDSARAPPKITDSSTTIANGTDP